MPNPDEQQQTIVHVDPACADGDKPGVFVLDPDAVARAKAALAGTEARDKLTTAISAPPETTELVPLPFGEPSTAVMDRLSDVTRFAAPPLIVVRKAKYLALDTETSGLFLFNEVVDGKKVTVAADDPRQPRLAQACMIALDHDLNELETFAGYVKPDGWVMTPEASRANGLTTDFLMQKGQPVGQILDRYVTFIRDGGVIVCCHNSQFDTKMMRGELRRAGRDDLFLVTPNFCTMRGWAKHAKTKWPKLADLCKTLGVELHEQHTAHGDTAALVGILRQMRARGIDIIGEVHTSSLRADD